MKKLSEQLNIAGGLLESAPDSRDFSHSLVFGSLKKEELPDHDFTVGIPLEIKDQRDLDFCAGFASASVSEDQENIPLCPHFSYAMASEIRKNYKQWGMDLRNIAKSATKYGFLEKQYCIYCKFGDENYSRDEMANPENYDADQRLLALDHKKGSYFWVDGPHDIFNNFIMTMWINVAEQRSILTGCKWRRSWMTAPGGEIPETGWENDDFIPHAFKIYGRVTKGGKVTLVGQLSNGRGIGYGGLFYFPSEVVNKEFTFKAITYKDMQKEKALYYVENGISLKDAWYVQFWKVVSNFFKDLLKR